MRNPKKLFYAYRSSWVIRDPMGHVENLEFHDFFIWEHIVKVLFAVFRMTIINILGPFLLFYYETSKALALGSKISTNIRTFKLNVIIRYRD